jgi:glyoxylase-like metal-dependent hydrolase (beta-lactamase superfamily II)
MLVDAGDYEATVPMTDPKPDLSRKAGEWITRYIERVNPSGHEVDYLMISHFHDDHTGDVSIDAPTTQGRTEDYKLIGVAEVGEKIRFKNFIDRGYPSYNYPVQISDPHTDNYLKFARYQKQKYGAKQEQF